MILLNIKIHSCLIPKISSWRWLVAVCPHKESIVKHKRIEWLCCFGTVYVIVERIKSGDDYGIEEVRVETSKKCMNMDPSVSVPEQS